MSDIVETTDEKGKVVSYYSEDEVIEMKRTSFYLGLLAGLFFWVGVIVILMLVL